MYKRQASNAPVKEALFFVGHFSSGYLFFFPSSRCCYGPPNAAVAAAAAACRSIVVVRAIFLPDAMFLYLHSHPFVVKVEACALRASVQQREAYATRIALCFNAYYNVYVDSATLSTLQVPFLCCLLF